MKVAGRVLIRNAQEVLKEHTHHAVSRRCGCGLGATRRGRLQSLTAACLELGINWRILAGYLRLA
jgi:hypothetical protein